MEGDDEACNKGLSLELRLGAYESKDQEKQKVEKTVAAAGLDLSFDDDHDQDHHDDDEGKGLFLKRGNEEHHHPNEESPDNTNDSRKKLRLTKAQSFRLEDAFKMNDSINAAQKQALAEELNLKPRQIEVWFQNRRARTKLKQTEVNCEFFKKIHEKLTNENLRLKKELEELRALKVGAPPLHSSHLSKASEIHSFCPSCRSLYIRKPNEGNNNAAISNVVPNSCCKLQRSDAFS